MRQSGFTLVELVVAMALSVIVIAFMANFISGPVQGYVDQTRRAELVDVADNSLRRLSRDVRAALPNSLRVSASGSTVALELLSVVDGGRYRESPPPAAGDNTLDFAVADASFNVVGGFTNIVKPFSSTTHHLAIYNVGVPGADAYDLTSVMTPAGTTLDISTSGVSGEDRVNLSPAFRFRFDSPNNRLYLVEGPVSWLCDTVTGTLTRHSGYAIASNQSSRDTAPELAAAGAAASLVADKVISCDFIYTPGVAERAGLLSAALSIEDSGETVRLLRQVHVNNAP